MEKGRAFIEGRGLVFCGVSYTRSNGSYSR